MAAEEPEAILVGVNGTIGSFTVTFMGDIGGAIMKVVGYPG